MMILRINGEDIPVAEDIIVDRQAKTFDTLDAAGDFSYSFVVPNTAEIRKTLGIQDHNQFEVRCELMSAQGITRYSGLLSIDNISSTQITLSFIAGNSDWFTIIGEKKVKEIPLSFTDQWKSDLINTNPSPTLISYWARTEGVVYPLVDIGKLKNWSIPRVATEDFLPMTYIRDLLIAIFKSNGLKYGGDLFKDAHFNTLVCGSAGRLTASAIDDTLPFFDEMSAFVANTTQTLTTTPQKLLFPIATSPYYVGSYNMWDTSTSRYQNIPFRFDASANFNLSLSASVDWTIEVRKNGVTSSTFTGTGADITRSIALSNLNVGDYAELWGYVSSGTADATGTMRITPLRFRNIYPQFMVGDASQIEFITSIFLMFNVISSYDANTKTVTCNFYENVSKRGPVDLSEYISDYEINTIDALSELSKYITFKHQDNEDVADIVSYNAGSDIPFGAGQVIPSRDMLSGEQTHETIFTNSFDYLNDKLRASLMQIGTHEYNTSGDIIVISGVADNGSGIAQFTTTTDHNFKQQDYVLISTASGEYEGLGFVNDVPTSTTFEVQFLPFGSTTTGTVALANRSINADPNKIFIGAYFANMPVSEFSSNSTINYSGSSQSNVAWVHFLKPAYGLPIDNLLKTVAFGKPGNNKSITLLQSYYGLWARSVDNPMLCRATMVMPESVYDALQLDESVTINTKDFSFRFVIKKISGYINSYTPFEVELLRLP